MILSGGSFLISSIRSLAHLLASKLLQCNFRCVNYFFNRNARFAFIFYVCQSVSTACFHSSITCYCFISFSACSNGYIGFYCLPFWFVSFSLTLLLFFCHFFLLHSFWFYYLFIFLYILSSFRFYRCIRLSSINWTKTYRRAKNSKRNYMIKCCVEKVKLLCTRSAQ